MNAAVQKFSILVVEDTLSEMELISHYLHGGGFSVSNAISAKDALARIQESLPDLILTDIVMPDMSGFELCRSLKRNAETSKIPVVFCSSKDQEIDRLWAMKQGGAAYVKKPFTREELLRVVNSILS